MAVGRRSPGISTAASRLRGYAFWEVLVFVLNAVLFLLVGLQLPGILSDQERSVGELAGLAVLISLVVIAARLVWINTVPYVIRALDRRPSAGRARRGLAAAVGDGLGAGCAARCRSPPRSPCRPTSPSATC